MKKVVSIILVIVMILTLWSTSMISTTLAKYAAADSSTESAQVAKWGVTVDTKLDLFSVEYDLDKDDKTVISCDINEDVVAPGTEGAADLTSSIKGKPEVAVKVTTTAEVTLSNWKVVNNEKTEYYCPLEFTIVVNGVTNTKTGMDFGTEEDFASWIEKQISKASAVYTPGTDLDAEKAIELEISWVWPFSVDDDKDTYLGNSAAKGNAATISISLTQTVVQINEYETIYEVFYADANGNVNSGRPNVSFVAGHGGSINVEDISAGDTILFGSYPQSDVTNEPIAETLNALLDTDKDGNIDKLPESGEYYSNGWTSYEYYINANKENYMWYMDVEEDGEKYRGVYFEQYRPVAQYGSDASKFYQERYGYVENTVYWFRYDPITWTVIEETSDGKAFIVCDMIIDAQAFQKDSEELLSDVQCSYNTSDGVPEGIYANNYEYSTIRKWLNETFYDTAFNELQKKIILTTTVDNSKGSAGYGTSAAAGVIACQNTLDEIFLLSYNEASNIDRLKKTSEYAMSQGAYADGNGLGWWWLRSFRLQGSGYVTTNSWAAQMITSAGAFTYLSWNSGTGSNFGIVPATWIQLAE